MKKNLIGMVCALSLLAFASCGPEQTSSDKQEQQIQADYLQHMSEQKAVAGTYCGRVTYSDGSPAQKAMLFLKAGVSQSANSGRNEVSETPILIGSISTDPVPLDPAGSNGVTKCDWNLILSYTGTFTKATGSLELSGIGSNQFLGTVENGTVSGTLFSPMKSAGTATFQASSFCDAGAVPAPSSSPSPSPDSNALEMLDSSRCTLPSSAYTP